MLKIASILVLVVLANAQDNPIVTTRSGQVQGVRLFSGILSRYFSFKGIPYAEPPVGDLRFRNPLPTRGWTGVLDGTEHGPQCPQGVFMGIIGSGGSEDCLFLNVYTPQLVGSRAVMVYIHGGSFSGGSGDSWIYGPNFFVNDDVILVTLNYRLGILGFLGTGDGAAQGNYGLKDIVMALRWIRENIAAFGGNPNMVTLFGESAGGVAAHYLMLSRMGRNLFQRIITQSGTALAPWAFQPNPRQSSEELAKRLNIEFTSTQDLIDKLREIPAETLVQQQDGWLEIAIPRGIRPFKFVPCVEAPDSPEDIFLTDTPTNLMKRGEILTVPQMMGYTSVESLFMIRELLVEPQIMQIFQRNPIFMIPPSFNISADNPMIPDIIQTFLDIYFNGSFPVETQRLQWAHFMSDHQFAFGIDRTIRFHAKAMNQPIFYFKFSYDGALNMLKRLLLLSEYPGAMHGDDIFYMFSVTNFPLPIWPTDHARTVRSRMVRLWTNFAKTGNPTPTIDNLIRTDWPRYDLEIQNFMDIGDELTIQNIPNEERLIKWKYFQDLFDSQQ